MKNSKAIELIHLHVVAYGSTPAAFHVTKCLHAIQKTKKEETDMRNTSIVSFCGVDLCI